MYIEADHLLEQVCSQESLNKTEFDSLRNQLKMSNIPFDRDCPIHP